MALPRPPHQARAGPTNARAAQEELALDDPRSSAGSLLRRSRSPSRRWRCARAGSCDWPRTTLLALAAVTVLACVPLVRLSPFGLTLQIDPSTEPLLPRGDPARAVYEEAVRDFGDDEVFVVAMETDDVFTRDNLSALRRVTDGIARLPGVRSVQSLADVIAFRYEPEDDWIDVGRFIEDIPEDPAALARAARARARRSAVPAHARVATTAGPRP